MVFKETGQIGFKVTSQTGNSILKENISKQKCLIQNKVYTKAQS